MFHLFEIKLMIFSLWESRWSRWISQEYYAYDKTWRCIFLVSLEGFSENKGLLLFICFFIYQLMSHTEYLELHAKRKKSLSTIWMGSKTCKTSWIISEFLLSYFLNPFQAKHWNFLWNHHAFKNANFYIFLATPENISNHSS